MHRFRDVGESPRRSSAWNGRISPCPKAPQVSVSPRQSRLGPDGAERESLLATKLHVPRTRPGLLARPRPGEAVLRGPAPTWAEQQTVLAPGPAGSSSHRKISELLERSSRLWPRRQSQGSKSIHDGPPNVGFAIRWA